MNYLERTKKNFDKMTKGLKVVGEALLINPVLFAIYPAKKVAEILDVSETMVIRFCKVIGYHGYSELQADVQHDLLSLKPIENLNNNEPLNSFEGVMRMDQQNIHQLSSKLDWDTAEKLLIHWYYQKE